MMLLTFLTFLSAHADDVRVRVEMSAGDADSFDVYDELKSIQDERWNLSLEQAKLELKAGLITPDKLITRAREIMTEQWGTPKERSRLADWQKEKELHEWIESQIGATNLMIWKRLTPEPGTCWTRTQEGGIIIRDIRGMVTVLHSGRMPLQVPPGDGAGDLYAQALEAVRRQLLTDTQVCTPLPEPTSPSPSRSWWDVDMGSSIGF